MTINDQLQYLYEVENIIFETEFYLFYLAKNMDGYIQFDKITHSNIVIDTEVFKDELTTYLSNQKADFNRLTTLNKSI